MDFRGSFPIPKILLRFFGNFGGGKNDDFLEKKREGGHANPNEFRCKLSGLPKKKRNIVF